MSIAVDFLDTFYGDQRLTNFGAQLFRLIGKADTENLQLLSMAFPAEVALYIWWMNRPAPPRADEIVARCQAIGLSV